MGNKNKKVIMLKSSSRGMMDQAIKDITDTTEELMNQLEIKKGMLQTVLDTAEEGYRRTGVKVNLRLAEGGYDFLFGDLHDMVESASAWDEEELEPIELFGAEDEDGTTYSVLVFLSENPEDDEAFDMNIALFRSSEDVEEMLTEQGWINTDEIADM